MNFSFTSEQQALLDQVETLTREKFAPRADEYDREAKNPIENWQDLRELGLLSLTIPREYGGLGVDKLTYAAIVERIARGCASTAMTVNMHSGVLNVIAVLGTPEQKKRYFGEAIEAGTLFCSWGSEPLGSPSRAGRTETAIKPVDGGYLVNGAKHFCTMAEVAGYAMVWCLLEGQPDSAHGLLHPLISPGAPGVEVFGTWDPLGMRGTVSPSARLTECFVRAEDVLGPPGAPIAAGIIDHFVLGYGAVYLGIGQGAFDFTVEYCRTKSYPPDYRPLAEDPFVQRHCGELGLALDSARLILYQAATLFTEASQARRGRLATRAKYAAAEAALLTTSRCIQIGGGRAAMPALPLARAYRDARTATLMPPSADLALVNLGKGYLGLATQTLPVR